MKTYKHKYSVKFSITTTHKDHWGVSDEGLVSALAQRINELADSGSFKESVEHESTTEHPCNPAQNTNFHILKELGNIEWDLNFLATRSMDKEDKDKILERLAFVKSQVSKIYK